MGTKQPFKGIHWELLHRQLQERLLALQVYDIPGTTSTILPGKAIRSPLPYGSCGSLSWGASGNQPYLKIGRGDEDGDSETPFESLGLEMLCSCFPCHSVLS